MHKSNQQTTGHLNVKFPISVSFSQLSPFQQHQSNNLPLSRKNSHQFGNAYGCALIDLSFISGSAKADNDISLITFSEDRCQKESSASFPDFAYNNKNFKHSNENTVGYLFFIKGFYSLYWVDEKLRCVFGIII